MEKLNDKDYGEKLSESEENFGKLIKFIRENDKHKQIDKDKQSAKEQKDKEDSKPKKAKGDTK